MNRGVNERDILLIEKCFVPAAVYTKVVLPDVDVTVVVQVMPLVPEGDVDENGWPKDFFERVAGSMPELHRAPQGHFEEGLTLNDPSSQSQHLDRKDR
jgi:hypothetical protein